MCEILATTSSLNAKTQSDDISEEVDNAEQAPAYQKLRGKQVIPMMLASQGLLIAAQMETRFV